MTTAADTSTERSLVLVTGAAGFLALDIIAELLKQGYRVRGTVRNLKDEKKLQPVKALSADDSQSLELVEADLQDEKSWPPAIQGCSYVISVAVPVTPTSGESAIQSTVDATLNVLKACRDAGTVRRVVMTGGTTSLSGLFVPKAEGGPKACEFSSEDWIDVNDTSHIPMARAKAMSEKAAWDFVNQLEDDKKFEFVVLIPSLMTGPFKSDRPSLMGTYFQGLLERKRSMVPRMCYPIVDVRDVATMHVRALTLPEVAGRRIVVKNESLFYDDIAKIIANEFGSQGYNVPTRAIPHFLLWLQRFFNPEAAALLPGYGKQFVFHADDVPNLLGREAVTAQDSILETCYCCIERGFTEKSLQYKGRQQSD